MLCIKILTFFFCLVSFVSQIKSELSQLIWVCQNCRSSYKLFSHKNNIAAYLTKIVQDEENIPLGIGDFYNVIPECSSGSDMVSADIIYAENHNSKKVQSDFLFEDTVVEKKSDIITKIDVEEYFGGRGVVPDEDDYKLLSENRFIKAPYVVAGIPSERFDWIMKNATELQGCKLTCEGLYTSQNYSWVHAYLLSEVTRKEYVDCQVYKSELERAVSIGKITKTLKSFNSNLMGYGQFTIGVKPMNYLTFFLTGFQLIDTTTIQRFPQPGLCAYPSDAVTEKLKTMPPRR